MKRIIIGSILSLSAIVANAGFEVKEFGLNGPGVTENFTVDAFDWRSESNKFNLSYDFQKLDLNRQLLSVRHVLERMPLSERAKVDAFYHDALIESILAPKTIPSGNVTVLKIVDRSPHDTSGVVNTESYDLFLRGVYAKKINTMVPMVFEKKVGNKFKFNLENHSDFKISKIKGSLVVSRIDNGQLIMDQELTETAVWVGAGKSKTIVFNAPSRYYGWYKMKGGLNANFTIKEIHFTNGLVFNADAEFKKFLNKQELEKLSHYPFNEI